MSTAGREAHYVVATIKPWNLDAFHRHRPRYPGRWTLIERREDLTEQALVALSPRYVFLPHWSWKVPDAVTGRFECVCFHMTDVPYGRGGSPLQNLILRGHSETVLTALRMTPAMDAGPVYLKRPLDLAGSAQDIYERASELAFAMIGEIVASEPQPQPQSGEPVMFERRRPQDSVLPASDNLDLVYDFIRMLDAETYPHAFLDHGPLRIEFTRACRADGRVEAKVTIAPRPNGAKDDRKG